MAGPPLDRDGRLKDLHTRYYEASAALLTTLPGARPLLQRVAESDLHVVLATSAPDNELALLKAGVTATRAVFVGDTVWDVEAAQRAGVACIGVLSGGVSRGELEDAGAAAVFDNAEDLLAHFGDSQFVTLR